jgi:hypothetical protein
MMRSLHALSLAALALAQPSPTWYGLVPGGGAGGYALVELNDAAAITRPVATIAVGAGEVADADAMRCLFGFCAFMATTRAATFAYRVNTTTGALLDRAALPGECPHLHVDYTSGSLYTLCSDGRTSVVYEVSVAGAPTRVLDVTAQVAGGRTLPGQTTHCSAFKSMYIGVSRGGAPGADSLVTVDLAAARAQAVSLRDPLWRALWARCDGSNEVGGIAFTPDGAGGGNGTATFGTVDTASGAFRAWASVGVPPGVEPTGLLTETETEQALAAFYPPRGSPAAAKGFLWAVDPFAKTGDDFVTPIPYLVRVVSRGGARRRPRRSLSHTRARTFTPPPHPPRALNPRSWWPPRLTATARGRGVECELASKQALNLF